MKCAWKTCNNEVGKGRRFCNAKCKSKFFVDKRRKELKQKAITYKGGKCDVCGYSKNVAALAFHHLDPSHKEFSHSDKGITRSWEATRRELDKCQLLCLNCHAELHSRQRSSVTKR
jgi:hypothetical protein